MTTSIDTFEVFQFEQVISTGKDRDQFTQIFAAGDGVLYGNKPDGSLIWYQHRGCVHAKSY